MRQDKDYYRVLQVPRDASQEDIKRAYRRLAREFHPDVNPGDKRAEERLKEINEAYAVLGDPEARQQYDRARTRVRIRRGEPRANRQPSPWADLFEIFFGEEPRHHRRPTRAEAPRGRTYEAHVTLDFEEAFRGKEVTLTVEGRRVRVAIPPGARDGMSLRVRGAGGRAPTAAWPVTWSFGCACGPTPSSGWRGWISGWTWRWTCLPPCWGARFVFSPRKGILGCACRPAPNPARSFASLGAACRTRNTRENGETCSCAWGLPCPHR